MSFTKTLAAFAAVVCLALGGTAHAQIPVTFTTLESVSLDPSTRTVIAAMTTKPGIVRARQMNALIVAWKASGFWQAQDAIWVLDAADTQSAAINWKNPNSFTLTPGGSPTLIPNVCYAFNGTTDYLKTGYVPSTAASLFTATNATVGVWNTTNVATSSNLYDAGALGSGLGQIDVDSKAAASAVICSINTTTSTAFGSTFTSSAGYTVCNRVGSTTTAYSNGVSQATQTPTGSVLPDRELYIGARNNAGTADKFSSRCTSLLHIGGALTDAQVQASYDAFAAYQLSVNPFTYVSSISANGIPIGTDTTGCGTIVSPCLTIEAGIAATLAGQTLYLNGSDPNSPTEYRATGIVNLNKSIKIDSVVPLAASIAATTTTARVILCNPGNGGVIFLGQVVVDGRGANVSDVELSSVPTSTYYVELNGTKLIGTTFYGIFGSTGATQAQLTLNNINCALTGLVRSCMLIQNLASGGVLASGGTYTVSDHYGGGIGAIAQLNASAAGVTAKFYNITGNVTIDPGVSGGGTISGLILNNIRGIILSNPNLRVTSGATDHNAETYFIAPTDDANALDTGGFQVLGGTYYVEGAGGYIGRVGYETPSDAFLAGKLDGGVISGGDWSAGPIAYAGAVHGIFMGGGTTNSIVNGAYIHHAGYCIPDKETVGMIYSSLLLVDCNNSFLTSKGANGTQYRQITAIMKPGETTGYGIDIHDNDNGDHNLNITLQGINFYGDTVAAPFWVNITANQTFTTFDYNNYYTTGTTAGQQWIYLGVTYMTFAAYQAAVELHSLNVDPQFVNAGMGNYALQPTSPLKAGTPYSINAPTDFTGAPFAQPNASIGAYQ